MRGLARNLSPCRHYLYKTRNYREEAVKKIVAALCVVLSLVGCGKSQEELAAEAAKRAEAEAQQKAAAERAAFDERAKPYIQALKEKLKDPDSAQFRNLWFGSDKQYGNSLCGEMNAKNSYGGYTGFYPFAVSDSPLNRGSQVVIISPDVSTTDRLLNQVYFLHAGCGKKAPQDVAAAAVPAAGTSSNRGK
jgi:hypothetical protein